MIIDVKQCLNIYFLKLIYNNYNRCINFMIKINNSDWRAIIILVLVFQIICLWSIDISTSAIINIKTVGKEYSSYLTNGFFKQDPYITYHLALFITIILSFFITLISIHHIDKNESHLKNDKNN